jgi:Asparagine synthase
MSKVIYAYSRNSSFNKNDEFKLQQICTALTPDNITVPVQHKIFVSDRLAYAIINHHFLFQELDQSLLVGSSYDQQKNWNKPKTEFPEGSYAIFRQDNDYLEIVSDFAASRTIWYYFDEDLFIASTSQRAIILFLGDFKFDARVIPWMLSTGTLGPELSWDTRIKRIPLDASVILDKTNWAISHHQNTVCFLPQQVTQIEQKQLLKNVISKTIESLKHLDFSKWALLLSGGYDSRAILCFLKSNDQFKTITWGLSESLKENGNDAKVAADLARALNVPHSYYRTDISKEPIEQIINRFILCGEGRIDHLAGYMDGLEIWRRLAAEEGVYGVIRGDEGFGWLPVSSELTVKYTIGCALCSDYSNLENFSRDFGVPEQEFPVGLQRQNEESLESWRDRLYHSFRLPTILAALSDIKYSYVEVINPLLSKLILQQVRKVPDNLRTNKSLFKEIVDAISPKIPYASKDANATSKDLLKKKEMVEVIKTKLQSEYARQIFGTEFINYVVGGIQVEDFSSQGTTKKIKIAMKSVVPRFVRNRLRDTGLKAKVDGNTLAFRVYIIVRMHEILSSD